MATSRKYNIGFLSDEEIISLFCVRIRELEMILETVRENVRPANQHIMVIGPRGCGKTTLLLRAIAEMRRDEVLKKQWLPVVFMEESYEIAGMGEFWLECLFQLIEVASGTEKSDLQKSYDKLQLMLEDDDALAEIAMARVLDFADLKQKRLALVVENFNTLFDELPAKQRDITGWKLRHALQTEPRIMLMAGATSRFDQIDHSDKALFELFRILDLKPLTTPECADLWQKISGNAPLNGTIKPIKILTGGSPRLVTIIARFGAKFGINQLLDELLDLVDDHTEYFKSHLESLPPRERRVYLSLADLWAPATAKEVARRARQDIRTCAAHLNRLIKRGVVVEDEGSKPRRKLYYLNERMYNIYYLLRRRRRPDTMVTALLRFMTAYYPKRKLFEIGQKLVAECTETDRLVPDLSYHAFAGLYKHLDEDGDRLLLGTPFTFLNKIPDRELAGDMLFRKAFNKLERILENFDLKDAERVIAELDLYLSQIKENHFPKQDINSAYALFMKGVALRDLNRPENVIACYDKLLDKFTNAEEAAIQELVAKALFNKGYALCELNQLEDAIDCYDELLCRFQDTGETAIQERVAKALFNKGYALCELNRFESAIVCFDELLNRYQDTEEAVLQEWVARTLFNKGVTLDQLHRPESAIVYYDKLLNKFKDVEETVFQEMVAKALFNKGVALGELNRAENAIDCFDGLLNKFKDVEETVPQELVAQTLLNKSVMLGKLNQPENEIVCYDELFERFKHIEEVALQELVAQALLMKGVALSELNQSENAINCFDEAINLSEKRNFWNDVINGKIGKAWVLIGLDRKNNALKMVAEILDEWTDKIVEISLGKLIGFLIFVASSLDPEEILPILRKSKSAKSIQPFIVALQQELGQEVRVSVEVREVAADIRKELANLREIDKKVDSGDCP